MIAWTALILAVAIWAVQAFEFGAWIASRRPTVRPLADRIDEAIH